MMANKNYGGPMIQAWGDKLDSSFDAVESRV